MIVQIIEGGSVVNSIVIPDSATIASNGASASWTGGAYNAPSGATMMSQAGAGIGWTLVGGALVPPAAPVLTLAQMQTEALAAAKAVAGQIVSAVEPDSTHQNAYDKAAMIVAGCGGVAPTIGPFVAIFASAAADYGLTTTQFATMLTTCMIESQTLSFSLNAIETAVPAATTSAQVATALAAFETAVAGVLSAINAVLPTPVAAPPAIVIPGVNA